MLETLKPQLEENKDIPQTIDARPGARLKEFAEKWSGSSNSVHTTIKRGFHWKWIDKPPALHLPNHCTTSHKIQTAVSDLLKKNAIIPVADQLCFQSRIFLVPKNSGGERLIIDLNRLNLHISAPKFKMTNHSTLKKLLQPPAWLTTLDISDAYLHVPIRENLQKYLAFSCNGQLYFFQALPFGLNVGPHLFTSILRWPLSLLHQEGIQVIAYLDDLIIWDNNRQNTMISIARSMEILNSMGFCLNYKKSELTPRGISPG